MKAFALDSREWVYRAVATTLLIGGLFFPRSSLGVSLEDFVPLWFTNAQGVLPYRLFIPTNYNSSQQFPLVMFLHGSDQRGNDNQSQLQDEGVLVFASETNQLVHPCFMVAPQCPAFAAWTDSPLQLQVLGMIKALANQFSIDTNRLYITGLSLGGYGVWSYIEQYPSMYAAAVPLAGGGDQNSAGVLTQMPIWTFHAANDTTVSVGGTQSIVSQIRAAAGGSPVYTEYASGGHGPWTIEYNTPILMDWVFSQRRTVPSSTLPLLRIRTPTLDPVYAATQPTLTLTGTADDGSAGPITVKWTKYRVTQVGRITTYSQISAGTAVGTTNWTIANLPVSTAYTNSIVVTATGTSWSKPLGGATTFNDTLMVVFPPAIDVQPQSQVVSPDDSVTFNVAVNAVPPPPRYQWRFNGTNILGATSSNYTISHAQLSDAGLYSVSLTNSYGSVLSSNATLVVHPKPVAQCADVVVSADSNCSGNASVDNGSYDPDGDPITLSQAPAGPYPIGTNPVVLTVIDSKGASNSCSASVIVVDHTPPSILCPVVVVTNAHDRLTSLVSYTPVVADNCSGAGLLQCLPPSGSEFEVGSHTVICSAYDAAGNSNQCSFQVVVWPGNVPPVPVVTVSPVVHLSGYSNLVAIAANGESASLKLDGSQSFDVDDATFNYSWYSGTSLVATNPVASLMLGLGTHQAALVLDDTFPLGITRTNVTIEVVTPADSVGILAWLVQHSILSSKDQQPLLVSLNAAVTSFQRGNSTAGVNQMSAFQNKLRAQVIQLEPSLAKGWISAAQEIVDLSGPPKNDP